MTAHPVPFSETALLPPLIRDYLDGNPQLKTFYQYDFSFPEFARVIADKKFPVENRLVLVDALRNQYKTPDTQDAVRTNIEKLTSPDTFTVTTAHQPVLFTGPLYFIYKIISAIHLAEQLRSAFPGKHFVPVYYMGCEDHDFEEINHAFVSGEKYEWQQPLRGASGRLPTDAVAQLIQGIEQGLGGKPHQGEIIALLKNAYNGKHTLAEATLLLVDRLFGEYGLVVVNPDQRALKKMFTPVIISELKHNYAFHISEQTTAALKACGYEAQASPREINLFYLEAHQRERIVFNPKSERFEVLNTALSFSEDEIMALAREYPERFSPNVMLRPLYQETILPNLAYVGGAGELSYWLQQKNIFKHYGVNFPMLVLRNSALLIDAGTYRKIQKSEIPLAELFEEEEMLVQNFIKKNAQADPDLAEEKKSLEMMMDVLRQKAVAADPTLGGAVESQKAAFMKGLDGIATRMMRAEKRNFETAVGRLRAVKSKLFPMQSLQERVENFIPYYALYGKSFFEMLLKEFEPFRREFLIFADEGGQHESAE